LADKEWFHFPKGEYNTTFLKAVAMAVHIDKLSPAELQYFFDEGWSQSRISKELYKRIKEDG
jgi:hypothetical protein